MPNKTFAIITDIHSNISALTEAISIINSKDNIDQIICLGDCFSLGPEPEKTLETLSSIDNCIFIRGNHDRYIIENLWEEELPTLEGMDPYDPVCKAIVENEKWTAEKLGKEGIDFIRKMVISHRDIIGSTLVEFTHAWYQRDDHPPTMQEALNWKKHVKAAHDNISNFLFVHGHVHIPRIEIENNLTIYCQGATGLPFDKDARGSVAFLTVGDKTNWEVVRFDYDKELIINRLEERKTPFYLSLKNTVKYASIGDN
tara:strand:+ start:374 stop:1144 length:771 start_codon:yes stop_codon:yes gene_type:complete